MCADVHHPPRCEDIRTHRAGATSLWVAGSASGHTFAKQCLPESLRCAGLTGYLVTPTFPFKMKSEHDGVKNELERPAE